MLSMFQASPQSMLAMVKPTEEAVNSQRVEKTRVSQPDSGIMMISAMRYAVCTQLIWSCAALRPPPMSWRDEATIWMSRSAMNMPTHITTNGPRLQTQLRSEATATDGADVEGRTAAVTVGPLKTIACRRRH